MKPAFKFAIAALLLGAGLVSAQTEVRRAIALPSYKDLKYPPLPPLKVPDPVELTLSNGMKILLLEDHELPLVSGAAMIRTGNLFDPSDKRGLAGLTGEVLRSGEPKRSPGISSIGIWRTSRHPSRARLARPMGRFRFRA